MCWSNGPNVKVNGCISNLSLTQLILPSSWLPKAKNSKLWTQRGNTPWNKPIKYYWCLKCARKMDCWNVFKKPTKIWRPFRENSEVTWRKKGRNLPDSISFQILISFRFCLRLNSLWLFNPISKKFSKT